jgi:hypothetical protein
VSNFFQGRKLIIGILFICFNLFRVSAQEVEELVISGITGRVTLESYLKENCSGSGCNFYYSENLLNDIYIYNTDNGKQLTEFLDHTLGSKGVAYILYKEKNLVFVERKQLQLRDQAKFADRDANGNFYNSVDIGDPLLAGKFRKAVLSGYVRNGKNGEPLPGAVIYIKEIDLGVVTDLSGYYSVELPVGKQGVRFSFMGFEARELLVNMISPGSFDIELFESTVAIDQVVILSNVDANVLGTEMSIIRLDAKTINNIPVLLGEPDLMKTMTLMPGVQSSGDMASGFNVRGGGTDQNLILIDDVPIYNANHLFGMFSIIDTRTIKNLELFKGGSPARYGGRASSVMNIDLKEGNLKELHGDGGIGLFSSKLTLQGPIINEKASYIIGGRTTYSDWILKRIPDLDIRNSSANFYDLNLKLNFTLNRNNRLSFFTYISKDKFNYAANNLSEYGNKLGALKWNHILNEKITFSLGAFFSDYQSTTADISNEANAFEIRSGIRQLGARFRTLISIGTKHSFEAGLEGNQYTFSPGNKTAYGSESDVPDEMLEEVNSMELAGYLQDVYEINDRISLSAGIRYSLYYLLGPSTINEYNGGTYIDQKSWTGTREYNKGEVISKYSGFEPRLSFRMNVTPMSSIKIGYSRNYQYLHIISNSTVVTPTDIWKSSDPYIEPAKGDQVAMGYFYNIKRGVYETSVELYYKYVQNVVEYRGGAQLIMNPELEQDLLAANMDAYGIEFLVRKNMGRLTGWVSYTYSRSFLRTEGAALNQLVNSGEKYPSYSDKPNDLSIVANYKISRRFTLGTSFTYSTGRPATYPESTVRFYRNNFPYYSDRNKYRLRDYHRLDVSLIWDTSLKKKKKIYSSWILSIYNVYGRNNVYSTYYKKEVPTVMNDYRKFALYELSIIGVPIPSLTYNLRF